MSSSQSLPSISKLFFQKVVLRIYRILFAYPVFGLLNTALFRLSLTGLGILNYENQRISGESYLIKKVLPRYISSAQPIFVDVGADIGEYTLQLTRHFPNAVIHSFEPHPNSFLRLKENVERNNVRCHNLALGSISEKTTIYDKSEEGSSHASLYKDVISEIHKEGLSEVEIYTSTLDEIAQKEGIRFIDFLKIDTEGHELAVLQGASTLLKDSRIGLIQIEFNEMNIISRVFLRDFRRLLAHYDLYRLLPTGLLALGQSPLETEIFAYQNIIALPKARN